jgi:hypothetical protein
MANFRHDWGHLEGGGTARIRPLLRKCLALAIARECQGAKSEVIVARPPPETSRAADLAAASAFSFAIRRYSAASSHFVRLKGTGV